MKSLLVTSLIMYFVAQFNYLLFHCLIEGFAIVVAILIYVLAANTYSYSRNQTFLFLGISYFHVALLDFVHTLTYSGMGVFPGLTSDVPTQLWIAGRFLEALSLVTVLFILKKRNINKRLVTIIFSLVTVALLLSIMVFKVFPVCFVEGEGLTPFKIISEYVIVCFLFTGVITIYYKKYYLDHDVLKSVMVAMIITALSELSFTLYTDVYGIANMVGHMLKAFSYYVIFSSVVAHGIKEPYNMMAAELKERATRDVVTNLYNRQGLLELMETELRKVELGEADLGVLMLDIDNFKAINDSHGHLFGDETLHEFAGILNSSIGENDTAFRFGGDEFVVLARAVDSEGLLELKQKIMIAAEVWITDNEKIKDMGISIGHSFLKAGQVADINGMLRLADKSMYAVKNEKRIGSVDGRMAF